jgi:GTP-binding protein
VHILLTKADKLKKGPAQSTRLQVKKSMAHMGDLLTVQIFSSLKKEGTDILRQQISAFLASDDLNETDTQTD